MTKHKIFELPENAWPHPNELAPIYADDIVAISKMLLPPLAALEKKLYDNYCGFPPASELSIKEVKNMGFHQLELSKGLFLAVASIWERQLRGYLLAFGEKLGDKTLEKLAHKPELKKVLVEIQKCTGVSIANTRLEEYGLVANVCRHGMGPSLDTLYSKHKDKWWPISFEITASSPRLWNMRIRSDDIKSFAEDVEDYWLRLAQLG